MTCETVCIACPEIKSPNDLEAIHQIKEIAKKYRLKIRFSVFKDESECQSCETLTQTLEILENVA